LIDVVSWTDWDSWLYGRVHYPNECPRTPADEHVAAVALQLLQSAARTTGGRVLTHE
jgi:hypothetical protein